MPYFLTMFDGEGQLIKVLSADFCHEAELLVISSAANPWYRSVDYWVLTDPFGALCTWRREAGGKRPAIAERSERFVSMEDFPLAGAGG